MPSLKASGFQYPAPRAENVTSCTSRFGPSFCGGLTWHGGNSGRSSGVVARLVNGLLNRRGWNGTRPDLEFAALDDGPRSVGLHFQNNAPGRCGHDEFLSRGMPAGRRNSRERTIRLEASSSTVVSMPLPWRGHGVFARFLVVFSGRSTAASIGVPIHAGDRAKAALKARAVQTLREISSAEAVT